ncbi:hypothetical protein ACHAO1_002451 [Botrytis cinerea]
MPDPPRGSERGKERKKRETTGNNGESEKYDFSRGDIKIEGRETPQRDDRGKRRDPPRSKPKEEIRSSKNTSRQDLILAVNMEASRKPDKYKIRALLGRSRNIEFYVHADNVIDANITVKPRFLIARIAARQSIAFDF